jgi:hypothetical protein
MPQSPGHGNIPPGRRAIRGDIFCVPPVFAVRIRFGLKSSHILNPPLMVMRRCGSDPHPHAIGNCKLGNQEPAMGGLGNG